jgi:hypothetical protein
MVIVEELSSKFACFLGTGFGSQEKIMAMSLKHQNTV